MFAFLKGLRNGSTGAEIVPLPPGSGEEDRRSSFRFGLGGRSIIARSGATVSRLKLKNLSCGGVYGITDLPAPVGGTVFLQLTDSEVRAAEVRWVRNTSIGLKFLRPLDLGFLLQIYLSEWDRVKVSCAIARQVSPERPLIAANEG